MKIDYDSAPDTLTVMLREGVEVTESNEVASGIFLDYDVEGNLVSLVVQDISKRPVK